LNNLTCPAGVTFQPGAAIPATHAPPAIRSLESMNKANFKSCAPQADNDFIAAIAQSKRV